MGNKVAKVIVYIFLIVLALMCIFPFLLMLVNATRTGPEIASGFTLIPGGSTLETTSIPSWGFSTASSWRCQPLCCRPTSPR